MYILIGLIIFLAVTAGIILNRTNFGQLPKGDRLARIEKSPNYKDGKFQNISYTPQFPENKSMITVMWEFFWAEKKDLKPNAPLPVVKTDLKNLPIDQNVLVWLGHSSYFIQQDGKRFLVDPTLVSAAPFSFVNTPFLGTDLYGPEDIPAVDYLIITHDHWDHLDCATVSAIKDRVGRVITGLGVGQHLEYWGFSSDKIVELDWYQDWDLGQGFRVTSFPARHFSGRGIFFNKTLWSSFMLSTPKKTIYIGGDSGYDAFYKTIAEKFPTIDLAIMEDGQYNQDWKYIHILPEELPKAVQTLQPKRLLAVHNSKYALARHPWYEPLERISFYAKKQGLPLETPKIGEVMQLDHPEQKFSLWWKPLMKK